MLGITVISGIQPLATAIFLPHLFTWRTQFPLVVWVWCFPLFLLAKFMQRRTIQKGLELQYVKGNWRMKLAPDGLYSLSADSQSFVQWSGISDIVETPTHAFFYMVGDLGYVLPARAFESDVAFHTFVGLARKYKEGQVTVPAQAPPDAAPDSIARKNDFTSR